MYNERKERWYCPNLHESTLPQENPGIQDEVVVQNILGTRQADDVVPGDEQQRGQMGFNIRNHQNDQSHQDPEIKKNGHLAL